MDYSGKLQAAWVPESESESMSWDDATAPAVDWLYERCNEVNEDPVLLIEAGAAQHRGSGGQLGEFADRWEVVTVRTASRVWRGPVLAYVPSQKGIALAMNMARGSYLAVVEGFLTPLSGWAMEMGAFDLLTGGVTPDTRTDRAKVLCRRFDLYSNNGFGDALGKQVVPGIVEDLLAEGMTGPEIVGVALARGCGERGAKQLETYLARINR